MRFYFIDILFIKAAYQHAAAVGEVTVEGLHFLKKYILVDVGQNYIKGLRELLFV